MKEISSNELKAISIIFKDLNNSYNANNLSKKLDITSMGTLKILKELEKRSILISKQLGKANFYKINFENNYSKTYLKFILEREAEESKPKIKKWIKEIRKIQDYAEAGILFGSVLHKEDYADIDLLLVLKKNQNKLIERKIEELNKLNIKKIHIIKQTESDLKNNLNNGDKILLSAINEGIILFGYEKIIEVIANVAHKG